MLETEIKELRKAIEALTAALEKNPVSATEAPAPEAPVEPEPAVEKEVPKNQDEVTFEMLKDATLKTARAGHKDAIREKLNEIGVSKIQDLEARVSGPEDFYKWLKELMQ